MSSVGGTRTCAGCVAKAQASELFKFPSDGRRHGYLHWNEECYKKAVKKNAFSFVLKRHLTEKELNDIKKDFAQQRSNHNPSSRNNDSGSR